MMMKVLLSGGDFERSLKVRRTAALAMLAVGLVGYACYFLLVPGSSLSNYAQGFYLGAATGITAGSLVLLLRSHYLLTHPEARQRAKIQETDERTMHITRSAFMAAGFITFFASTAALFVVLPLSMDAFRALLSVMILYCLMFVAARAWLSKKL